MAETWSPLNLADVRTLFADFGAPWWIAGGTAIELAVREPIRDHKDLDILILRRDQQRLRSTMNGWDLHAADSGILRPWPDGETLSQPINSLWCRRRDTDSWALEVLLDEAVDDVWVSRRCTAVRRSISSLGWFTSDAVPVLAPGIQLFYKAKDPRPEDESDFSAMLPRLTLAQSRWLDETLAAVFPSHSWRQRLKKID